MAAKIKKPKPNRNISRAVTYDADGNVKAGGWLVRFNRNSKTHQQFFGDSKHGGERKALAQARIARDELEQKLPSVVSLQARRIRASLAGLKDCKDLKAVGVRWSTHRVARDTRNGPKEYEFLFAITSWVDAQGVRHTASFSASKYGKKQAWQLACDTRAKALRAKVKELRS